VGRHDIICDAGQMDTIMFRIECASFQMKYGFCYAFSLLCSLTQNMAIVQPKSPGCSQIQFASVMGKQPFSLLTRRRQPAKQFMHALMNRDFLVRGTVVKSIILLSFQIVFRSNTFQIVFSCDASVVACGTRPFAKFIEEFCAQEMQQQHYSVFKQQMKGACCNIP
jgi:hypothetical protein